MTKPLALALGVFLGAAAVHAFADWPQWQGPDRNRISKETGLLPEWPSGGPRVLWTANGLGRGYGSVAVAGDRVFLQGGNATSSVVIALNRTDGRQVWAKVIGPAETRQRIDQGAGPRGTPTVDGDRCRHHAPRGCDGFPRPPRVRRVFHGFGRDLADLSSTPWTSVATFCP